MSVSDLQMGFFSSLAGIYSDPTIKTHRIIYNKFVACPLTEQCLNRTAFQRDFAVIKNKKQAIYLMSKYYTDPGGKPMIYAFDDIVIPILPKYYLYRGNPLLARLDHFLLLFQSNGLAVKWDRDIAHSAKVSKVRSDNPEQQNLTIGHLQGPFFLLLFGYLLSIFTFFIEILRFKFKQAKYQK